MSMLFEAEVNFTFYRRDVVANKDRICHGRIPNAIMYLETENKIRVNNEPIIFTKCEIQEFDKIELKLED